MKFEPQNIKNIKQLGCTRFNEKTYYLGEIIYIDNQKYYPTIMDGYKGGAVCDTLKEAQQWISDRHGRN